MSNTNAAQEPSMEEILASIRRIISDEEAAIGGEEAPSEEEAPEMDAEAELSQDDLDALFDAPEPAAPEPEPEPEAPAMEEPAEDDMAAAMADMAEEEAQAPANDDVLDLQPAWQEEDLVEPDNEDLMFAEEEPEPEPAPMEEQVSQILEEKVPPLLQATIETAPTPDGPLPAIDRGAPLVSDSASEQVTSAFDSLTHTIMANNSRTIENVVEDMLRPMLKAWLDQNLPVMVERLIRAEIERVSRGEQHYR